MSGGGAPLRVTVSPVGPVVALCHLPDGGPVLVLDDGSVSLRLELGALSGAEVVALRASLHRALADIAAAVGVAPLPPPPYAVDPAWVRRE